MYHPEAAPPVRLVRLWPDHFSSRPDYNIKKLHTSQDLSFPKRPFGCCESASSSLKIHAKFFPSFAQTDQHFAEHLQAPPSVVRYNGGLYHFVYAAAAHVIPDTMHPSWYLLLVHCMHAYGVLSVISCLPCRNLFHQRNLSSKYMLGNYLQSKTVALTGSQSTPCQ